MYMSTDGGGGVLVSILSCMLYLYVKSFKIREEKEGFVCLFQCCFYFLTNGHISRRVCILLLKICAEKLSYHFHYVSSES